MRDYTAMVTSRRAVRLLLALEAWKLQRGSLPETLDKLVGPCLDRLPVDPYSGQPFHYFRDGLTIPLQWNQPHRTLNWEPDYFGGTISANVPFIWSTGAKIYREPSAKSDAPAEYRIIYDERYPSSGNARFDFRWPASKFEVWESGWPFPIP